MVLWLVRLHYYAFFINALMKIFELKKNWKKYMQAVDGTEFSVHVKICHRSSHTYIHISTHTHIKIFTGRTSNVQYCAAAELPVLLLLWRYGKCDAIIIVRLSMLYVHICSCHIGSSPSSCSPLRVLRLLIDSYYFHLLTSHRIMWYGQ